MLFRSLDSIDFISINKNGADYVTLKINENIKPFFDLRLRTKIQDSRTYDILLNDNLKNEVFMEWIVKKEDLKKCKVDDEDKYYINLKNNVEELELKLQQSTELL